MSNFSAVLEEKRKAVGFTQVELDSEAGVGLRLEKVNKVKAFVGKEVDVVESKS